MIILIIEFFISIGFETSSSTSSFALYNLSLNQDLQEKTREEIQKVIKNHDGKITYEAIMEMKYLQMVIDGGFEIKSFLSLSSNIQGQAKIFDFKLQFFRNFASSWSCVKHQI